VRNAQIRALHQSFCLSVRSRACATCLCAFGGSRIESSLLTSRDCSLKSGSVMLDRTHSANPSWNI